MRYDVDDDNRMLQVPVGLFTWGFVSWGKERRLALMLRPPWPRAWRQPRLLYSLRRYVLCRPIVGWGCWKRFGFRVWWEEMP